MDSYEEDDDFEIEQILYRMTYQGQQLFFIKWLNYPLSEASWNSREMLESYGHGDTIELFEETVQEKPGQKDLVVTSNEDGTPEYVIEKIFDRRVRDGQVEYLISWESFGQSFRTWESSDTIKKRFGHLIEEYEHQRTEQISQ